MSTVVEDQTGSLSVRLERLIAAEPWQLSEDQVKAGLADAVQLKSIVDAAAARFVAVAEDLNLPSLEGCTSTSVWLSHLTGISWPEAKKIIDPSRELNDVVEETRRLWSVGVVSTAQATIICKAINALPDWVGAEERSVAQAILLQNAKHFDNPDLQRLANHILEVIDPDGVDEHLGAKLEEEEKKALLATSLKMFKTADGMTRLRGLLPNVQAGMLRSILEGLASPRRNSPQIYDRDGEHSDAAVGPLTHDQKLGRALCELLEHLPADAMPSHGGLASTVTINIDLDKLRDQIGRATLSTGDEMSASQARRFACNANLIPIVLDGDSQILDLGLSKRLHNRYQRIAIANRDQGCVWRGCDRPPAWCEVHHPEWWSHGGPTDLANGALFCFFHHHLLHNGEWDCRVADDGIPEVIPPPRIDPQQKPMRHRRFKNGP